MDSFLYVPDANIRMSSYDSFGKKKSAVLGVLQEYFCQNNRSNVKANKAEIVKELFRYIFRDDVFGVIIDERFMSSSRDFLGTLRKKLLELVKEPELRCLSRYEWFYKNLGVRDYNLRESRCRSYANLF